MSQLEWLTEISDKLYKAHSNLIRTGKVESGLPLLKEVIAEIHSEREILRRDNEELSDDVNPNNEFPGTYAADLFNKES